MQSRPPPVPVPVVGEAREFIPIVAEKQVLKGGRCAGEHEDPEASEVRDQITEKLPVHLEGGPVDVSLKVVHPGPALQPGDGAGRVDMDRRPREVAHLVEGARFDDLPPCG